jgi:4-hydroxybenzoyl-CoA reductase subunit beta
MLRLPPFDLHTPSSLAAATDLLAAAGAEGGPRGAAVRIVAGGTDLLPNLKRQHDRAATIVSLRRVDELRSIARVGDDLRLGATATLTDVARHPEVKARYPGLARAVTSISSPVLRNMGTIGGNLCLDTRCTYYNQSEEWRRAIDYCMKEEGKVCWVAPGSSRCWAIAAGDSAPMLHVLGATVELASATGTRRLALADLHRDDGIAYLTKRPDEILTAVDLPAASAGDHCRTAFWKLRRRGSIDFAVLSVAAAVWTDVEGAVTAARVALGAVASAPVPVSAAGEMLVGQPLDRERIAAVASAARRQATPMDNTDFQTQWRGVMVERYVEAALCEVAGLALERLPPRHA